MWTVARLEYEENTVQLFCRASGFPEPTVTWYDWRNHTLEGNAQFSVSISYFLIAVLV
jgi:hypothetical protein